MPKKTHELQIYEDLDHSFYNIEKLTRGIKDDEEQPRAAFLHDLAKEGRMSVHNARGITGMTPKDYAGKILEMMDEESLMRMGVEGLRFERDQISHLLEPRS